MFDAQILAFTVVAFVLTLTPGADTLLVIRHALSGGRLNGIVTGFGICCGLFFHAVLSAVGVSMVLIHSPGLFNVVKLAGAGYLFWIGCRYLRSAFHSGKLVSMTEGRAPSSRENLMRCYSEGLLCNMLNPKVALFYLAFLPQFISPGDPVLIKSLVLALIHFFQAFLWLSILSLMLDWMRTRYMHPAFISRVEGICGALIIALSTHVAFQGLSNVF